MVIGTINYAEVESTKEELIANLFLTAECGESVGITGSEENISFLFKKIMAIYDVIGTENYINIGKGRIYFFYDKMKEIKNDKIDVLFCDVSSIIGRMSLPLLNNIRMIKML